MTKVILAIAAVTALCGASVSAMAFPVAPVAAMPRASQLQRTSFGGWPFPYGYAWSRTRACTRYEAVETRSGRTRWQRIWVCGPRAQTFYRG